MKRLPLALLLFLALALPVSAQNAPEQRCLYGETDDGTVRCFPVNGPAPGPVATSVAVPTQVTPPTPVVPAPVPVPPTPQPTPVPTPEPPPPAAEPQLPDLPGLVAMVQLMENANWNVNDAIRFFQNQLNEAIGRGSSSDQDTFNAAMAINWLFPDEWRSAPFGRSTIGAIRGELCINGVEQIPDCAR